MNRRTIGLILMIAGPVITVLGVLGVVSVDGGDASTSAPATAQPTETEPVELTTTTGAPATTTTTSPAPTTTTDAPSTTSATIDAEAAILAFFDQQVAAIETGDVEFLYASLHPVVMELFPEDLCRSFIEREILALDNYQITGAVTGPETQSFESRTAEVYSVDTSFVFQGANFEATATFAIVDDGVRWFTQCR